MKKLFVFLSFLIFFAAPVSAQKIKVVEPQPRLPQIKEIPFHIPQVQEVVADNGIKAWLIREESTPVIAVSVLFNGGSAADPKRLQGLTPLAAALLDEGAGRFKADRFQQILAEKAINLSFSSGSDYISADMETLVQNKDEAFDLLRLTLTEPRFDTKALRRVKKQMEAAIDARKGDPNAQAYERFLKLVFKDHPYSRTMPTKDGVGVVTRTNLKRLVRQRFARDNLFIGVVGNITAAELKVLLEKTFEDLPKKARLPAIEKLTPDLSARVDVLTMDVPQSAVVFGHQGIARGDPDYFAALLVNYTFGGGSFASRLFAQVREKNGLAYSVGTSLLPLRNAPLFIGSAASENAKLAGSIDIIKTEWQKMAETGPSEAELNDAKTYLTGSFPLSFTSSSGLASFLAGLQYNGEDIDYLNNRNARMKAVSIEDARRTAARLLNPESLFFVVVGKPANL